jgi:hypothetical protein
MIESNEERTMFMYEQIFWAVAGNVQAVRV